MNRKEPNDDAVTMTVETVAGDLLNALMQELRLLPDIWPKLPEAEQEEIVDRLRKRVADNVREAARLIASAGRMTIVGELKKVTFGDKIAAVFEFGKHDPSATELVHAQGLACLVVVADGGAHMGGLDAPQSDPDQPNLPGVGGGDGSAMQIIEQASRRSKTRKAPPADDASDPLH